MSNVNIKTLDAGLRRHDEQEKSPAGVRRELAAMR
jgi:hypothetical protein